MQTLELDDLLHELRSTLLALGYQLAARRYAQAILRVATVLQKSGFNPDQPRDVWGRWTENGEAGDEGGIEGEPQLIPAGGPSGYPIDILTEDAIGGHTFERHVGKSQEYLFARITGSRTTVAGIFTFGERRAGSFSSLEAANKLVNSTIAQNSGRIVEFVSGRFPYSLPVMYIFAECASPTGYEAYARNDREQPRLRSTYGVTVRLRRTGNGEKGYYVDSAWPMNED